MLERDNFDGAAAVTKRVYGIDLRRTDADGYVEKTLVVDLLKLANPAGIGARRRTAPGTRSPSRSSRSRRSCCCATAGC